MPLSKMACWRAAASGMVSGTKVFSTPMARLSPFIAASMTENSATPPQQTAKATGSATALVWLTALSIVLLSYALRWAVKLIEAVGRA